MNASHPKMAVLRCRALQCPARAAMPRGVFLGEVDMRTISSSARRFSAVAPCQRRVRLAPAGVRAAPPPAVGRIRPVGDLAFCGHHAARERTRGDSRPRADRPVARGALRGQAARAAAQARAGTAVRRGLELARRAHARLLRAARRRRRACPAACGCTDFEKLGLAPGAVADGARVVVAGGPDYYPGSRTSSPGFSFDVNGAAAGRRGRPARPARPAAQAPGRRGPVRAAEGAGATGAAALDRRGDRRGRQGARRRARRPGAARLGRATRLGLRARAGPPRRPGASPARCRTSPRSARST